MREHKRKQHGAQRGSRAQNVDVTQLKGDIDENGLKEELETSKRFLVDSEMENGWHTVYSFSMDTLDAKYLFQKLDVLFHRLKSAAILKVAFASALKNVKEGVVCIIMHTKVLNYWRDLNLWLLQKTWQKSGIW